VHPLQKVLEKFDYDDHENRAHEGLLNDKYQHVYLFDSDTDEVRRIVHVEWCTTLRPARYALITQLMNQQDGEEDLVSYHINESLYECIRAAPAPYNQQRRLISN